MKYDINKVTPRPWAQRPAVRKAGFYIEGPHPGGGEWLIAEVRGRGDDVDAANADHIFHCVNTHEALVAALEAASEVMEHMGDILNGMDACMPEDEEYATPRFEKVNAALALARGES